MLAEIMGVVGAAMVVSALPIGVATARYLTDGKWHQRYTHKCGHHAMLLGRVHERVCAGCGEQVEPKDFEVWTARARFPWGWEWGEQMPNERLF